MDTLTLEQQRDELISELAQVYADQTRAAMLRGDEATIKRINDAVGDAMTGMGVTERMTVQAVSDHRIDPYRKLVEKAICDEAEVKANVEVERREKARQHASDDMRIDQAIDLNSYTRNLVLGLCSRPS
jgi:hypothetical protein